MNYKLTCRALDSEGLVLPKGHPEGLGYKYKDIEDESLVAELPEGVRRFRYAAENKATKLQLWTRVRTRASRR